MTIWRMIGSSPSVYDYLPRITVWDKTITCNHGICIDPNPDVYICCDMKATHVFSQQARAAQATGTHLVTLRRAWEALEDRDCEWYDEHLENGTTEATRDAIGWFQYSGPLCLDYVLHYGSPTRIELVGCDGYRYGDGRDYVTGDTPNPIPAARADCRAETLRRAFQQRARVFPEIPIIQHGDPVYTVDAPNWEIRR